MGVEPSAEEEEEDSSASGLGSSLTTFGLLEKFSVLEEMKMGVLPGAPTGNLGTGTVGLVAAGVV